MAVIVFLSLALALGAEPISQLKPTDYVNDFAHVLNQATVAQLDDICRQIDEKAHAQIAVVTIKSLDGSDIESYAVGLYKQWGIGSKATNRGVLVLVATQDHRYRTEVGYGLEPILPDGKVGGFGREAVPFLRQNDYDGAISLVVSRVAGVIAQDAGVQLTGASPSAPPEVTRRQPDKGLSAGGVVILILVVIVLLFTPFGRGLLLVLLSGGGGRGGWGGGGFGGGGGGFGGFGGGSSGGGGASGSW